VNLANAKGGFKLVLREAMLGMSFEEPVQRYLLPELEPWSHALAQEF
jgi:hypothetical protein